MTETDIVQQWRPPIVTGGEAEPSEWYWSAPDPATGFRVPRATGGPVVEIGGREWPDRWHCEQYVRDLKREVAGIEQKLALGLDAFLLPQEPPSTREQREAWQADLEGTRTAALAEIERYDTAKKKRRKR